MAGISRTLWSGPAERVVRTLHAMCLQGYTTHKKTPAPMGTP